MNCRFLSLALAITCAACSGTTSSSTTTGTNGNLFTGATSGAGSGSGATTAGSSGTPATTGPAAAASSTGNAATTTTTTANTTATNGSTSTATSTSTTTATNSSSTGGTSTSTTTTTGATSSSSSGCTSVATVAEIRALAPYTSVCVTAPLTTVLDNSPGAAAADGGTKYGATWYMADSTGAVISVYKDRSEPLLPFNPVRPDNVLISAGTVEVYPLDAGGGAEGTTQVTGYGLTMAVGTPPTGTVPTPQTPQASDLVSPGTESYLGQWVTVPAGSYTENRAPTQFTYVDTAKGETYYDGLSLSDGTNTILVDTYTFLYASGYAGCITADGGQPDLSQGGFNGVFDVEQTDDGKINDVIFYACGEQ